MNPFASAEVFLTTLEVVRGERRNIRPQAQGAVQAGLALPGVELSAGAWSALDWGPRRAGIRPELHDGAAGPAEWSAWGQVELRHGHATAVLGVIHDRYRRHGTDPRTTELYGRLAAFTGRWALAIEVDEGLEGMGGRFLEPSITYLNFVNPLAGPAVSLATVLTAGYQWDCRCAATGVPGPRKSGLTHVMLRAELRVASPACLGTAAFLTLGPVLRYGRDPATRLDAEGRVGHHLKLFLPVRVGMMVPFWERGP